eukprot:COSAG02_NODE_6368_length_3621_cov_1.933844_5_plen_46_part_00
MLDFRYYIGIPRVARLDPEGLVNQLPPSSHRTEKNQNYADTNARR